MRNYSIFVALQTRFFMLPTNNYRIVLIILVFSTVLFSCQNTSKKEKYQISEINEMLYQKPTAQQIDSIFQVVDTYTADEEKIDLLLRIYKKSIREKPIRHDILDAALLQAEMINYKLGIGMVYDKKGLNARYDLKYQESVNYHKIALGYFEQTTDTFRIIKCLNSLGVSLRRLNYEREAIDYYLEALRLAKVLKNDKSIAISLNGIGNVFVNIEQYERAKPYFREALAIERKNDNKRGIKYDLSNLGEVFMYLHQYDSALYYYNEALSISKHLKRRDKASIIFNCIGQLYQLKGDYERSNKNYYLAIPVLEEFNGKRYLSNTYINIGKNFLFQKNYDLAFDNINKGYRLAMEIQSPENIILGYQALYEYYRAIKKYDLALINYQKNIQLRDSIKGEETKRNIAALETIYENERRENEIKKYQYNEKLHQQKDIILWMLIIFLFLSGAASIILYQYKKKNNKLVLEQMRNDLEEYLVQIKELQSSSKDEEKNEKDIFHKNVEKYGLSVREIDVLLLISEGLKNDEIAEKLFLSVSTIKTHTRNVFIKLDVRNRIEASRKAQSI